MNTGNQSLKNETFLNPFEVLESEELTNEQLLAIYGGARKSRGGYNDTLIGGTGGDTLDGALF
jgi:Ca2+-binding RTX toxin-like protein